MPAATASPVAMAVCSEAPLDSEVAVTTATTLTTEPTLRSSPPVATIMIIGAPMRAMGRATATAGLIRPCNSPVTNPYWMVG